MLIGNLPPLLKNVSCAVTGHRIVGEDFDGAALEVKLKKIASLGYEIFLVGMAIGFDLECFAALKRLREKGENIKICAVIPCSDQSVRFDEQEKKAYNDFIASADYTVKEDKPYYKNCMLVRNDFLVDNSSLLLAYYDGRKTGGTAYTISRAVKRGVDVVFFDGSK